MDKEKSVITVRKRKNNMSAVRNFRKSLGMSQEDFAGIIHVSKVNYNKKENGKVKFSLDEAFLISNHFKKPIEIIFGNDEITGDLEQSAEQDVAKERQDMNGKRFTPEQGKVYKNKGGGEFLCIQGFAGDAIMWNVASGWTFTAHGVIRYENGCIEWDYSTGGHFDRIRKHCRLCEAGFIGDGWMIRANQRTNDYLCRVVERFQFHSKASKSDNPMVAEMALKMCEVEIWEMWVLTQE